MPIYRLEPIDDFLREQSWKHTLLKWMRAWQFYTEKRYIRIADDEQAFKFLTASFRLVAGQVDQGSTVGPLQLRHDCLCLSFERGRPGGRRAHLFEDDGPTSRRPNRARKFAVDLVNSGFARERHRASR